METKLQADKRESISPEQVVVQEFSSRYLTPRMRLSDEYWEYYGLGPFSSENVPFAGRTGMVFAQKVVAVVLDRFKHKLDKGEELHLYEFGAGTGLLAKHILDILQSKYPTVYAKIKIHISDISAASIERIKSTGVFEAHGEHIAYEVVDAANPHFGNEPDFVYHTYLADSLPTRHIKIDRGQVYEIQVKTAVKKGAKLVDTTQNPPIVLDEAAIALLINDQQSQERRRFLAPRILNVLEESFAEVKIEDCIDDSEEREILAAVAKEYRFAQFNYSHLVFKSITEILKELSKNDGSLLISDFGRAELENAPLDHLVKNFGVTAACPVDFPILAEAGEQAEATTYITSHRNGAPQEILFDTRRATAEDRSNFEELFGADNSQIISSFFDEITVMLERNIDLATKRKRVTEIYDSLPADYQSDFQLLNNLANKLIEHHLYEEAINYANIVIEDASHVCGPTFRTRARAYMAIGRLEEAKSDLFRAISISEIDAKAYDYLSILYENTGSMRDYIEAKQNYLKCTRSNDVLETMQDIAKAHEQLGEPAEAEQVFAQIVSIGEALGSQISTKEREIFEQVLARKE